MNGALGGERRARVAVEHDAAAIHHHDPRNFVSELVDAMFDHHDRRAILHVEAGQHGEHFGHAGGIEIGGRLVENQQARLRGQDGGDADALLLTARKLEYGAVAEAGEADKAQGVSLTRQNFGRRPAEILETEANFVAHTAVDDLRVGVLKDHADLGGEFNHFRLGDRLAAHPGVPRQCSINQMWSRAVQQIEQRALAGSARPKDQHELAAMHCQREIAQDRFALAFIGVADPLERDHRLRGPRLGGRSGRIRRPARSARRSVRLMLPGSRNSVARVSAVSTASAISPGHLGLTGNPRGRFFLAEGGAAQTRPPSQGRLRLA